jgi:actin-related protein
MLNYALENLGADSAEHPLLLTEAAWTPRETREELTEMAFEGLGAPAYYLANSTVLSS